MKYENLKLMAEKIITDANYRNDIISLLISNIRPGQNPHSENSKALYESIVMDDDFENVFLGLIQYTVGRHIKYALCLYVLGEDGFIDIKSLYRLDIILEKAGELSAAMDIIRALETKLKELMKHEEKRN